MKRAFWSAITESSQVGASRREAVELAISLGLNETRQGEIALIVTELGNNLVRHASHGELSIRAMEADDTIGIEVAAIDKGPGMASISQCMTDGYSTAGTPGFGLGAVSRLSNRFDAYSTEAGSVLFAQLWSKPTPFVPATPALDYGVFSRPKPREEVCGDSWAIERHGKRHLFFIADGLGHGPDAAIASQDAVRAFRKSQDRPKEILEAVHRALGSTRGAAGAIAEVDLDKREVCFAGIGNIAASVVSRSQSQSMVSHNGILGHQMRKVQEFTYSWSEDAILVMHSDGLSGRWQLDRYPGLMLRHPRLIAGVLYRDFQRDNDDATVLVASNTSVENSE